MGSRPENLRVRGGGGRRIFPPLEQICRSSLCPTDLLQGGKERAEMGMPSETFCY